MNKYLQEAMTEREDNYILPFFWPYEGHNETIATEIEKIYESGCRAFCIESRPFEDFGKEGWWSAVELMLKEAQKRDMKVWILDDKHFPTGYANGLVQKKYPERRRHYLREHHIDLMGPHKQVAALIPPCLEGETILSVCAWKRSGVGEELCGEPIKLDIKDGSDMLYFDVPEGCWRVFVIYDSPIGSPGDHRWYINMLSEESVDVLIEAVYEEHYKHFADYFGNTIAGFFSDEPSFGCEHISNFGGDVIFYYRTLGQPGVALPWNSNVADLLEKCGVKYPLLALPALWWPVKDKSSEIRLSYMNVITKLWNKNFSYKIGDWCRSHGVEYIGHIIEDMNSHSRLGGSAGHYFRALSGQDMSGIDIVLHQVMPGMGRYPNAAITAGGVADPSFFHYTMVNLASSLSRIEPHMKGRAMCEVFGAFGWAEGAPFMKWLIDFLLVRGINHFVPHAFSARPDNPDCPPHFYANGCNPQYDGFGAVMRYANRVSHILSHSERQVSGAILYYAENEWMSGNDFMYCDIPARALYDAQIDYDIIPLDALKNAEARNGILYVNGHPHSFFVIPQARVMPRELKECVIKLENAGVPVFTAVTEDCRYPEQLGLTVTAAELIKKIREIGLAHNYGSDNTLLRIGRFKDNSTDYYMLFNEEPKAVSEKILMPSKGEYLSLNLLTGDYSKSHTEDGEITVELKAGESVIIVFGDIDLDGIREKKAVGEPEKLELLWDISVKEAGKDADYRLYKENSPLLNITGAENLPDFSGYIKYIGKFETDKTSCEIDLGEVGQTARLYVNGIDMGIRVCEPYLWDISDALRCGENTVEIIAANTLVNRIKDRFSVFMPIPPSGVIGPVTLAEIKK